MMRIAIVYDCLFPWTIGGAERWYRNLAERLATAGYEVTYLTLRQWGEADAPNLPGVTVKPIGPRMALYAGGKRRIWPPLRFGLGLFWHLLWHGRRYDRLHLASFPFFSLLAAGILRPVIGYRIAVDWHEVWTDVYWRRYLGWLGQIGIWTQRLCARVPQQAYSFSRLHARRAQALGVARVTLLSGEFAGTERPPQPAEAPPHFVYAGRLIPEKRVTLLVEAFARLGERAPSASLTIFGDGPEAAAIDAQIAALGATATINRPGFVAAAELDRAMSRAAAIIQPSEREGYGMVVVEGAARGVPVIIVPAPDNAASELIDDGQNGFVAAEASPEALAAAMEAVIDAGPALRDATRTWFRANSQRVSIDDSIAKICADIAATRPNLKEG